jgi:hypothetical protein
MKKTRLIAILVAFLAISILLYANLLRPFWIEKGIIAAPDKKPLIVERHVEDMVISDAASLEIRNQYNTVIAYTQSSKRVGVFCTSLQFCWAFPYDNTSFEPMHLDYKNLDYNTTIASDYMGWYSKSYHFSKGPEWLKWLSPFIILIDNFFASLVLAILFFLPFLLAPWYFAFAMLHNNLKKWALLIAGALILILYSWALIIITLVAYLFNLALPILYCASIILISIFSGIYVSKNFRIKAIAKAFEKLDTSE